LGLLPNHRHSSTRGAYTRGMDEVRQEAPQAELPTKEQVLEALKVVYDPEIPVNIVDLGLVYDVEVHENGVVDVTMTLTAIGCPAQDVVKADAEMAVMRLPGVQGVNVEFVWTPPWTPAKMTEEGKRMMRMFGFNV
jgi:metal-sulfur cluster biosynthetic enzyme